MVLKFQNSIDAGLIFRKKNHDLRIMIDFYHLMTLMTHVFNRDCY